MFYRASKRQIRRGRRAVRSPTSHGHGSCKYCVPKIYRCKPGGSYHCLFSSCESYFRSDEQGGFLGRFSGIVRARATSVTWYALSSKEAPDSAGAKDTARSSTSHGSAEFMCARNLQGRTWRFVRGKLISNHVMSSSCGGYFRSGEQARFLGRF